MMKCVKVSTFIHAIHSYKRFCHFESKPHLGFDSLHSQTRATVGIFWDLDNKPPNSFPPFDAATKLKRAASEIGVVRFTVAYANQHAFSYVSPLAREQTKERKALNLLERSVVVKVEEPYICRVCGRRFYSNEKLVNHFNQIHEREHKKRLNKIESARGKMRVKLMAKYAMKMMSIRVLLGMF
ncbi:hypothetical protein P3S67_026305 [Capsicum chacoense]